MMCGGFLAVNSLRNAEKLSEEYMNSAVLALETVAVGQRKGFFKCVAVVNVPKLGNVAIFRSHLPEDFHPLSDMPRLYTTFQEGSLVTTHSSLCAVLRVLPMELRETPLVPLGDMRARRVEFEHQVFHVLFKDGMRINSVVWNVCGLTTTEFLIAVRAQ